MTSRRRLRSVDQRLKIANRQAVERAAQHSRRSDHITVPQLRSILQGQGYRCVYCPTLIIHSFSLDHRIPLVYGGLHILGNIHFTCPRCNVSKNTNIRPQFREWDAAERQAAEHFLQPIPNEASPDW